MDTEEDTEIAKAIRNGTPQTDEGPYYHEPWWESYKGGVKGKFGGAVIGALVGAVVGVAAASIAGVVLTGGITLAAGAAVAASFAAGGMLYGAHEFSDVGKITGAVAAAHEKSEERMKAFENGKFSELKTEINEIKQMMGGKPATNPRPSAAALKAQEDHSQHYRTMHCDDDHCPPEGRKLIFWKVALVGLAVGLAAGALLAFGGGAEHILGALGGAAAGTASKAGIYAASMTTLGLFGASFGINRDIFRQIFDKTDLLFRGIFSDGKARQPTQGIGMSQEKTNDPRNPAITTIVYDAYPNYPQSDTYHRDKVLSSAKQALLSMDHTKSIPH